MFKTLVASALTATLLATTAPVYAVTTVKDVVVTADATAIKDSKAAQYWSNLSNDLKDAILTRVTDRIADDGVKITVEIDSAELANTLQQVSGTAESKLVGGVAITSETNNTKFDGYTLTISFDQAGTFFPAGTDLTKITTDSKEYYDAMVAAFADGVVRNLK